MFDNQLRTLPTFTYPPPKERQWYSWDVFRTHENRTRNK